MFCRADTLVPDEGTQLFSLTTGYGRGVPGELDQVEIGKGKWRPRQGRVVISRGIIPGCSCLAGGILPAEETGHAP